MDVLVDDYGGDIPLWGEKLWTGREACAVPWEKDSL